MTVARAGGIVIRIRGTVQGVGFRPWVYRTARAAGVTGRVWNDASGVAIEAFGDDDVLARFVEMLRTPPRAARIESLDLIGIESEPPGTFSIGASAPSDLRIVSIPADLAACDDCVREIFDPSNRRYRYPFTNCTNCGPRLTIATDIPYDRGATTMARFAMCEACRREYDDPLDRRFHAQPIACPVCGPQLALYASDGALIHAEDPIAPAAIVLRDGLIVAIKGIGGFHLACDAANDEAVRRLRARKHRDEKPFAVMVRDAAAAERLVRLGPAERELLQSVERPILLAEKRDGCAIAPSVAPRNRMLGILLPYTPLHHLLLAEARGPLVMTSGNVSDDPIASGNAEALHRLGSIADLFLMHDREIETRCDDSVAAVVAARPVVIRRSRGYVPRAVRLPKPVRRPTLGCGALLKNTFCLAAGDRAWLGPHVGDLEHAATFEFYQDAIARMERFLEIRPEVVAHDLHPDYLSTQYAQAIPDVIQVRVQHHHAHVVSAMAEHGIDGAAIGIAYDGTGYGTDGTMWGGEVLYATAASYERIASFRAIPLPGADRAIREPWRIALALVVDAFEGDYPDRVRPLFDHVPDAALRGVRQLLASSVPQPLARGVGRYFDAFGALFLRRASAAFEGQIALEWNQAADPGVVRVYRFGIAPGVECAEVDLRPAVKDALTDLLAGEPAPAIAAAFHNTIAAATEHVVRRAITRYGGLPVVASGGCFQNARLAESVKASLEPECRVFLHEQVPPGDGGIALGQVVIAGALTGAGC